MPSATSAWAILHNFVKLSPGDVVVQTNGSSATGIAISEIGSSLGLKVISVTESDLKDSKFIVNALKGSHLKLAVAAHSGASQVALTKALAPKGVLVAYYGPTETLSRAAGLQMPTCKIIFHKDFNY